MAMPTNKDVGSRGQAPALTSRRWWWAVSMQQQIAWTYPGYARPPSTLRLPQGPRVQKDREMESGTPQIAGPHSNHMWLEREHADPSVSQSTVPHKVKELPWLDHGGPRAVLTAPVLLATEGYPGWLWTSDAHLPPLPAPTHLPGIHPNSQGLLCCHWPSAGLILATP